MPRKKQSPIWEKAEASGPWLKMFHDAWLEGTAKLSYEERGLYIDLLMLMSKADGPIPHDPAVIAKALGGTARTINRILGALIEAGKIIVTDDGMMHNGRLFKEVSERKNARAKMAEGGQRGGIASGKKGKVSGEVSPETRPATLDPKNAQAPENTDDQTNEGESFGQNSPPKKTIRKKDDPSLRSGSGDTPSAKSPPKGLANPKNREKILDAVKAYNTAAEECGWKPCDVEHHKFWKSKNGIAPKLYSRLRDVGLAAWVEAMAEARESAMVNGSEQNNGAYLKLAPGGEGITFLTQPSTFAKLSVGGYRKARLQSAAGSVNGNGGAGRNGSVHDRLANIFPDFRSRYAGQADGFAAVAAE